MSDITVYYSGVDNAGEALAAGTKAIQSVLQELDTMLNSVKAEWYGNSAETYTQLQQQWNTRAEDMNHKLSQAHVNLGDIRQNYSNTDNSLALSWTEIGG